MATIRFHSLAESAYLWTAIHVADEKGVDYEVVPLTPGSQEHLALHPFGKMPAFQHGAVFLYETLAIAHYIDRAFAGRPLQPVDALGQAQVLRCAFGFDPDLAFLAEARAGLLLQMRLIDEAVADGGFLVGSEMTLADSFLLPQLLFFTRTPEGSALLARSPAASEWLSRMQARPSYAKSPMSGVFEMFQRLNVEDKLLWAVD